MVQPALLVSRILLPGILLCAASLQLSAQQFDIYVFDVKTGATTKATHIPGGSCYNVTWSNNGKKIAHDVVGGPVPFGQSIYITDLTTGNSTPLQGAEGGNDASWSPNGNTIAFDEWVYVPEYYSYLNNIYLIDPLGGVPTLFRLHSNHASWSPNSHRIAFVDNWYGYIGTRNLLNGTETFVTYGSWPSWSPNGQYIAYTGPFGGVYVVKVDTSGQASGSPVQLSASGYGPTWSENSKTIVFIDWPNGDPDLYSVPASGGTPQRLTGRVGGFDKGDYDPCYSNNGKHIAYSSFTDPVLTQAKNMVREDCSANTLTLQQNAPNPFHGKTVIGFHITNATTLKVEVYNSLGQNVRTLSSGAYTPGNYSLSWDGRDNSGIELAAGLYYCRLFADGRQKSILMSLLK